MDRTKRRGICCAGVLLIALRRVREMKKEQWLRFSGAIRNYVVQALCPSQVWVGRKTMSSYSGTEVAQRLEKASASPSAPDRFRYEFRELLHIEIGRASCRERV